jgi:murein L,D-transpeptidase YafK
MAKASFVRNIFAFVAIVLVVVCQTTLAWQPGTRSSPEDETQPAQRRSPLTMPLTKPKIVVRKASRELLLYSSDKLVRTYHVGLGLSPLGDKVRAGDRRTPEGDFYIFTKNDKSASRSV